jgi:iron complex transport system ATP-binding protein
MTASVGAAIAFEGVRLARKDWTFEAEDVRLPAGCVTVLLGANGSGKTTALRLAAGLAAPDAGCVRVDGRPVHAWSAAERARRIALVPQRGVVGAPFTVRQVVEIGRHALPRDPQRVAAALEMVGLQHRAGEPYHHLSVGQQHRVALARALAQYAPGGMLLLDETLGPVDPPESRRMVHLVRSLAAEGGTVILATHDLALAAAAGDWAWYLAHGSTVAFGRAADVLAPARLAGLAGVPVVAAQGARGPLPVSDLTAILRHEP